MEFRRLCEILRNHLQGLSKFTGQANVTNVNNPESWQMHLQTRFVQLNVATDLSLWQVRSPLPSITPCGSHSSG